MRLLDIMINTRFEILQGGDLSIKNITIDSRFVGKGSLFFCIKGLRVDGHDFIEQAFNDGAAAVVVDRIMESYPKGLTIIKAEDTRIALSYAAANFYGKPADDLDIIGVTGTNGKTSTTYFVEGILKEYGQKSGIIGTVDTRIGDEPINIHSATSTTPDAIELQKIFKVMRDEKVKNVVMEVTSHALALHKIEGVNFKVGIFTNLTQDHLDFHENMEEYKKTKKKLFEKCEYGVFNLDDEAAPYMMENTDVKPITYSVDKKSDLQAKDIKYTNQGVEFSLIINGKVEDFKIFVSGKFTVYNVLATIGTAILLNIPIDIIKSGLEKMKGVPGRIQSVQNDKGLNVIVDYAHTPDGLENLLSAVGEFTEGKVITIFGCGGDRDRKKRPIMGNISGKHSDYCIITSDNPRTEEPETILDEIEPGVKESKCLYEKILDRKQAISRGILMAKPSDTVVIAGKGHENYQIFAEQTIHFDDYEVASEILMSIKN